MKTKDTYMKMSWITVTEESMDKERKCVVKHEKNRGGVDQEILFPAIKKVVPTMKPTEANLKNENGKFQSVFAFISCHIIFPLLIILTFEIPSSKVEKSECLVVPQYSKWHFKVYLISSHQ
uniref:Uncharacterized protein n=1 Tax=Marmota marmota marmota TaxID=9994 RepID=A0A8C5ZGA9_MARMA